jgi:hypothetical protein
MPLRKTRQTIDNQNIKEAQDRKWPRLSARIIDREIQHHVDSHGSSEVGLSSMVLQGAVLGAGFKAPGS